MTKQAGAKQVGSKLAVKGLAIGTLAVAALAACGTPSSNNTAASSSSTQSTASSSTAASSSEQSPAPSSPPANPGNGGTATCAAGDLKVTLGQGNGAAGSVYVPIVFTNTSDHSCSIAAYPGVSYVGANGQQLGDPADRVPGSVTTVVLTPGQQASAALQQVHVENFDPSQCQPTQAKDLRVYPPNDKGSILVPVDAKACSNSLSQPQLTVKPVQAGASAQ